MDRGMDAGNGMTDAELRQWLGEVFPVLARGAKLPRSMEKAANRAVEAVPVGTTLRWVEMLRIGKPDEIRLMAHNIPNAAAKLGTPEGQQAIRGCEATQRVVPVLRALERAVKMVRAFWRAGGHPRRAVIRALAVLGASEVVPNAEAFREELAATMGACQSSAVCLIEKYAGTAVANEGEKVESIDRLIFRSLTFGPWVRSFWLCLRLRIQGTKTMITDFDLGHPLWRLSLILREIAGRKGKGATGR